MLTEKHILDAGGTHFVDEFKTKWIDLDLNVDEGRSKYRFYNIGDGHGFNVYILSKDQTIYVNEHGKVVKYFQSIQFVVIKTLKQFKAICAIKKNQ